MSKQGCDIGLIGLGTMGRNFVLNMADHGFCVAVYNRTPEKTRELWRTKWGHGPSRPGYDVEGFIGRLRRPRAFILLVAAGGAVDTVVRELLPLLGARRSHHRRRQLPFHRYQPAGQIPVREKSNLWAGDFRGGSRGTLGPSLMPGGSREM